MRMPRRRRPPTTMPRPRTTPIMAQAVQIAARAPTTIRLRLRQTPAAIMTARHPIPTPTHRPLPTPAATAQRLTGTAGPQRGRRRQRSRAHRNRTAINPKARMPAAMRPRWTRRSSSSKSEVFRRHRRRLPLRFPRPRLRPLCPRPRLPRARRPRRWPLPQPQLQRVHNRSRQPVYPSRARLMAPRHPRPRPAARKQQQRRASLHLS